MAEAEPQPPETLSFVPRKALQPRMLLAASDLNKNFAVIDPANKSVPEFTKETLTDFIHHDYTLFNNASTNERRRDAGVKREQLDQKVREWAEKSAAIVKTDERGKTIFGDNHQNITADNMVEFYNAYFTGDDKKSNLKLFVQDTITRYTVDGQVDVPALEKALPDISWFAHVFGGNSAEIVAQLIDAEVKLQTNPDEFIQEGNRNVNNFTEDSDDERLLKFLWSNRPSVQPSPDLKPAAETSPPAKALSEPIRVTPEQNLRAAQTFCTNLREKLKNGKMEKWNETYRFTDPQTGIYVNALNKNAVDSAWFYADSLESYAEKNNLPFVMLIKGGDHFNLLLKGPELHFDGKYKILVYDPFHNAEDYIEIPISENFQSFSQRKLVAMQKLFNSATNRYELQDGAFVEKQDINRYLFANWFKPPQNMNISYGNPVGLNQLITGEYDLSILEDPELPQELKLGKAQQFQFNGSDCGPISLYTAVLRYAAKPGREQEKQKLVDQFATDFCIRILTRKELLGQQTAAQESAHETNPEPTKPPPVQIDSTEKLVHTLEAHPADQPLAFSVHNETLSKVLPDLLVQAIISADPRAKMLNPQVDPATTSLAIDPADQGKIKGTIAIKTGAGTINIVIEIENSTVGDDIVPSSVKVNSPLSLAIFNLQKMADDHLINHPMSDGIRAYLQKTIQDKGIERTLQNVGLHINPTTQTLDGEIT